MANNRSKIKKINQANSKLPRLVVTRSNANISAQIVDDSTGEIVVSASSLKLKRDKLSTFAKEVGNQIAQEALNKNISKVVFDRSKYKYHGAVKILAEAAMEAGLKI